MNKKDISAAVKRAELRIGTILAALERETASLVDDVEIRNIAVTTVCDEREQIRRRVAVDLKRLPGTCWEEG